MPLTVNQRAKLKITRQFIVAGFLLGIVYIFFVWGFTEFWHYLVGAITGIILGMLIALLELMVFSRGAKRLKFIWLLTLRTFVYFTLITAIIFNAAAIARIFRWNLSYFEVLYDQRFIQDYLVKGDFSVAVVYTLILAFSVNFVRMVSRKMGQGMMVSYISGTYYTPVHQARIFMFVKLVDSEKIMHDLGPHKLHKFLNDLFYDFTIPVVTNRGIIYEYIEDLVVITWAMDKGMQNANCIRAFFDMQEAIKTNKEKYLKEYGFIPSIQAGLHAGSVVRAEIGEVKTQIVFHGDTMNTTSRILAKCSEQNMGLLASDQLIRMIGLPRIYLKRKVGEIELKGKQEPLKLFEVIDNVGKK